MKPRVSKGISFYGALIDPSDARGSFEQPEMDLARETFHGTDRVLVAGCGVGWLAAFIASQVEHVLTFEPLPGLAAIVRENVYIDGQPLDVVDGAVGAIEGPRSLWQGRNWAQSTFVPQDGWVEHCVQVYSAANVMDYCLLNAVALDVEGAEGELVPVVLSYCHALLVELHSHLDRVTREYLLRIIGDSFDITTFEREGDLLVAGRRS